MAQRANYSTKYELSAKLSSLKLGEENST